MTDKVYGDKYFYPFCALFTQFGIFLFFLSDLLKSRPLRRNVKEKSKALALWTQKEKLKTCG